MKKLLFLLMLLFMPITVLAQEITASDLENEFKDFYEYFKSQSTSTSESEEDISYTFEEDKITFSSSDSSIEILFTDEDDKIMFTTIASVQDGMSYDEYENEIGKYSSLFLMYPLVAHKIADVSYGDSFSYVIMNMLGSVFSSLSGENNNIKYMIVDDDDTQVESTSYTIIKKSEFPNYVLEYTRDTYSTSYTLNDSSDADSFSLKYDYTDNITSIDINYTFTINKNADFTLINGYEEKLTDEATKIFDLDIDLDADVSNTSVELESTNNTNSISNPHTGINGHFVYFIATICVGIIMLILIYKKQKIFKKL